MENILLQNQGGCILILYPKIKKYGMEVLRNGDENSTEMHGKYYSKNN